MHLQCLGMETCRVQTRRIAKNDIGAGEWKKDKNGESTHDQPKVLNIADERTPPNNNMILSLALFSSLLAGLAACQR